jgi:hypothetical protein
MNILGGNLMKYYSVEKGFSTISKFDGPNYKSFMERSKTLGMNRVDNEARLGSNS